MTPSACRAGKETCQSGSFARSDFEDSFGVVGNAVDMAPLSTDFDVGHAVSQQRRTSAGNPWQEKAKTVWQHQQRMNAVVDAGWTLILQPSEVKLGRVAAAAFQVPVTDRPWEA